MMIGRDGRRWLKESTIQAEARGTAASRITGSFDFAQLNGKRFVRKLLCVSHPIAV
ncbi:MAG: hypothetical protein JWO45_2177 [Spartobacteria bacterium]|nr:hypothetical protein [Spartobacteria bacterium]